MDRRTKIIRVLTALLSYYDCMALEQIRKADALVKIGVPQRAADMIVPKRAILDVLEPARALDFAELVRDVAAHMDARDNVSGTERVVDTFFGQIAGTILALVYADDETLDRLLDPANRRPFDIGRGLLDPGNRRPAPDDRLDDVIAVGDEISRALAN